MQTKILARDTYNKNFITTFGHCMYVVTVKAYANSGD